MGRGVALALLIRLAHADRRTRPLAVPDADSGAGGRADRGAQAHERPTRSHGGVGQCALADPRSVGAHVGTRRRDHGEARSGPAAGGGGRAGRESVAAPRQRAGSRGRVLCTYEGAGRANRSLRRIDEDIRGEARVRAEWNSDSRIRFRNRRWWLKVRALAAGGWPELVPRTLAEEGRKETARAGTKRRATLPRREALRRGGSPCSRRDGRTRSRPRRGSRARRCRRTTPIVPCGRTCTQTDTTRT